VPRSLGTSSDAAPFDGSLARKIPAFDFASRDCTWFHYCLLLPIPALGRHRVRASSIIHMVLPYHRSDYQQLPEGQASSRFTSAV